ncbi:MAG: hypothetical protein N2747_03825 [Chitinophagaceae bacterium]|nr:hypothetical protein [Chitinophagaceae bacterium]
MDLATTSLIISLLAFFMATASWFYTKKYKEQKDSAHGMTTQFRLQAYERLTLFCERTALPNLIRRINQPELSATEMKILLMESINREFEYNCSQQMYVSREVWDIIRNMKEQNLMIIRQVSASLSPQATGSELNKKILEFLASRPELQFHESALKALHHEVKRLIF